MAKKIVIDLMGLDGTVTAIEGIESERFEKYSGGSKMEFDVDAIKKGIWTRVALYLNKKLGRIERFFYILECARFHAFNSTFHCRVARKHNNLRACTLVL